MYKSESIISNLLIEVDSLSHRLTNIKQAYRNTAHLRLRERLLFENNIIMQRLVEILSIAKIFKNRTKDKINFSSLLVEKCERIMVQRKIENNLFFL